MKKYLITLGLISSLLLNQAQSDPLTLEQRVGALAKLAIKCGKKQYVCEKNKKPEYSYRLETGDLYPKVELVYFEGRIELNFYMDHKCGSLHFNDLRDITYLKNYEKLINLRKVTKILEEKTRDQCSNPNIC